MHLILATIRQDIPYSRAGQRLSKKFVILSEHEP
jgi:hypothetical protein